MEGTEAGELINALRTMGNHKIADWVAVTVIRQTDFIDHLEEQRWIEDGCPPDKGPGDYRRQWPDGPLVGEFVMLTQKQRDTLLAPVKADRVRRDNNGMSYLEGYEVVAHLNRLFGFEGWDKYVQDLKLVFEDSQDKNGRTGWYACYSCIVRLVIRDPGQNVMMVKEDAGTGEAQNQPQRAAAHDLAIKTAVTDALKRCAKDLGDQFGLSLYRKGSTDALVKVVIPYDDASGGGGRLPL